MTEAEMEFLLHVYRMTDAIQRFQVEILRAVEAFRKLDSVFIIRRCQSCYLPMKRDYLAKRLHCDLCGTTVDLTELAFRSRRQRMLDWITGMDF